MRSKILCKFLGALLLMALIHPAWADDYDVEITHGPYSAIGSTLESYCGVDALPDILRGSVPASDTASVKVNFAITGATEGQTLRCIWRAKRGGETSADSVEATASFPAVPLPIPNNPTIVITPRSGS